MESRTRISPSVSAAIGFIVCLAFALPARQARAVSASGDLLQPSQSTSNSITAPILESVAYDTSAGPWLNNMVNDMGHGIASGNNVAIIEELTNSGGATWTAWSESVASRTAIDNPDDAPGFLISPGTVSVEADLGSGFLTLVSGTDYVLTTTDYSGEPFSGNNGNWEAIRIDLMPSAQIAPGDKLRINKEVFEVFGDGNVWQPDEAAQIAEFPVVPEPGALAILALAAALPLLRVRRHQRRA
jgi:hypothetical protein